MPRDPVVFISSTSEDLKEYREQAARAATASGFSARMMEYFPAAGHAPSLQVCLEMVAEAEVVVVLVAHRYGWVPDDPSNIGAKSITWLECEHAWNVTGKEVLAFLVDADHPWPAELKEGYRLVTERKKPGILEEVDRNEKKLAELKKELSRYVRAKFTDPASLRPLVSEALAAWGRRHLSPTLTANLQDPDNYLKALEDDTRQIRIKGLKTKRAEPYFFGIDEIYIPLTTIAGSEGPGIALMQDAEYRRITMLGSSEGLGIDYQRRIALERALTPRRIVMVGGPGSGKSTFLRRVAFELSRTLRGTLPPGSPAFLAPEDKRFPILIRGADLAVFLAADKSPKPHDAPGWIPYFLGKVSGDYRWGLDEAFFLSRLEGGGCLIIVDGLDEAPEQSMRVRIARILENATRAFARCDFLVSTRPQTNVGDSVLAEFHSVRIGDLEPTDIRVFFDHFARALALTEAESKNFKDDLELALQRRPEIREMAANPVMLTALAVLQHNDQRLPEYRVDLYGSILGWLAAARDYMEGRPPAEKILETMRKLALHMQDARMGRLVQINKRQAAEFLAGELGGSADANEDLLERETNDSGIISSIGSDIRFWHLSFQEYLAAREIASFPDKQQIEKVVQSGKLYLPEWRETMRLLGGVLRQQGEAKIEGMLNAILGQIGAQCRLRDKVPCVALLSAMMRDLSRMNYKPKTPLFEQTVMEVMAIFDTGEAEGIDLGKRIEAADLLGQVGDPRLEENIRGVVPAGMFHMGAQRFKKDAQNYDPEANDNQSPVHEVILRPFRIGRFPVTVHEFSEFIADRGYQTRNLWADDGFNQFNEPEDWERQQEYPSRPVAGVSWFEATAYCSWAGGRLATEAEWERTARGPEGGKYPWGNEPVVDVSRANYGKTNIGHSTPVGLFPKGNTSEGMSDMLGNVWEWCADWFGTYATGRQHNPAGPKGGQHRVVRGGSWVDNSNVVLASYRRKSLPATRNSTLGFRWAGDLR
jgi:formylglycine-generating enzyme required for sulfatase activity